VHLKKEIAQIAGSRAITPIILPSEDRIRMTRLYEEVLTRLEEMAMITARTLKVNAGVGCTVTFNPLRETDELDFPAVQIIATPQGHGCYDYRDGACFRTIARSTDVEVQQ
jgi:hypothetical protein